MNKKKMIAPIIVTLIFLFFDFGYLFLVCCEEVMPMFFKAILVLILAALNGVIIYVLIERIKEIRSGEEDDLSKY